MDCCIAGLPAFSPLLLQQSHYSCGLFCLHAYTSFSDTGKNIPSSANKLLQQYPARVSAPLKIMKQHCKQFLNETPKHMACIA